MPKAERVKTMFGYHLTLSLPNNSGQVSLRTYCVYTLLAQIIEVIKEFMRLKEVQRYYLRIKIVKTDMRFLKQGLITLAANAGGGNEELPGCCNMLKSWFLSNPKTSSKEWGET